MLNQTVGPSSLVSRLQQWLNPDTLEEGNPQSPQSI